MLFSSFLKILSFFRFLQPQEPRNLLYGFTIGYCIVYKCNGMFFKISTPRILATFFLQNLQFFVNFFWHLLPLFSIISCLVFPLGFDNQLLESVFWPWISFQLSNIANFIDFLKNFCHFLDFFSLRSPINSSTVWFLVTA